MIQSTLGRVPRHETYKQYPQGMHSLMYEMAKLVDDGEWNEDNKEMYIKMFTDKLREERDDETLNYFRNINNNRTDKFQGITHKQEEKEEEEKIMKEFVQYKNRSKNNDHDNEEKK
jgi:hypothetical protein